MIQIPQYAKRRFLFLQGPHGPFFFQLSRQLRRAGAQVWRVGFNAGDRVFWPSRADYVACRRSPEDWPEQFASLVGEKAITDIVLYGDTRPVHAGAIAQARRMGLTIHVFEEGYLRPYWVTYERGGSNGHSPLTDISLEDMRRAQTTGQLDPPVPPSHWGDMRQHVFYGALYHWFVMTMNRGYPHFRPHRSLRVGQEFRLYLKRLAFMPLQAAERGIASLRIRFGGFPYHLALLQLEHDASFQMHGPFEHQRDFVDCVISGFSQGAPRHHHLVFKAHPLEDGRTPLRTDIRKCARRHGVADRVHFVRGGKLAKLLNDARSAVTVNSTAGQQALWRGIPLRAFGASIYDRDALVSRQPLPAFFAAPDRHDPQVYRDFRNFLLGTSQLPGSYYARKGRAQLLRQVADMMLAEDDPYGLLRPKTEAVKQHITLVR